MVTAAESSSGGLNRLTSKVGRKNSLMSRSLMSSLTKSDCASRLSYYWKLLSLR